MQSEQTSNAQESYRIADTVLTCPPGAAAGRYSPPLTGANYAGEKKGESQKGYEGPNDCKQTQSSFPDLAIATKGEAEEHRRL
jgi:hypothetical protein